MIILCKILIVIAITGIIKIAGRESFNILFYLGILIHGLRNMKKEHSIKHPNKHNRIISNKIDLSFYHCFFILPFQFMPKSSKTQM